MRAAFAAASALLAGCGYIGPPQSLTLEMPQRIIDLTVVERGDRILAQFTVPLRTTEGLALKSVKSVELRVGVAPNPWNEGAWAATAKPFDISATGPSTLRYDNIPVREWVGKEVTIAGEWPSRHRTIGDSYYRPVSGVARCYGTGCVGASKAAVSRHHTTKWQSKDFRSRHKIAVLWCDDDSRRIARPASTKGGVFGRRNRRGQQRDYGGRREGNSI